MTVTVQKPAGKPGLVILDFYISFGLPGPLQTALELKIDLKTSKNQPDATALTENAINWLKLPKNIKILCRFSKISKKHQKWQIWGAHFVIQIDTFPRGVLSGSHWLSLVDFGTILILWIPFGILFVPF